MKNNNIFAINEDFFDDVDIEVNNDVHEDKLMADNLFGIYFDVDLSPRTFSEDFTNFNFKLLLIRFTNIVTQQIRIFDSKGKPSVEFIFSPSENSAFAIGSYIEQGQEIPKQKYTYDVDFSRTVSEIDDSIYMNVMNGLELIPSWPHYSKNETHGCKFGILFKFPGSFLDCSSVTEFMNNMIVLVKQLINIREYVKTVCISSMAPRRNNNPDFYFYYRNNGQIIPTVVNHIEIDKKNLYKELYNKLYDSTKDEYTIEEKKHLKQLENKTRLNNIYHIWYNIYFKHRTKDEFEYTPLGYNSGTNIEYIFYGFLNPKKTDAWTFENINDWFKETFIDACPVIDKINACRGFSGVYIEFFISVPKDNLPPRSDKKKTYVFKYTEPVGPNTIVWKLFYVDSNFIQVNHVSTKGLLSDNAQNAFSAYREFKDDLINGVFGKKAISYMPDVFKK